MADQPELTETCAVCGNVATGGRRFSRLYHQEKAFPLCCRMCIDVFQRAPDRFARGEHPQTITAELIEQLKWPNN